MKEAIFLMAVTGFVCGVVLLVKWAIETGKVELKEREYKILKTFADTAVHVTEQLMVNNINSEDKRKFAASKIKDLIERSGLNIDIEESTIILLIEEALKRMEMNKEKHD